MIEDRPLSEHLKLRVHAGQLVYPTIEARAIALYLCSVGTPTDDKATRGFAPLIIAIAGTRQWVRNEQMSVAEVLAAVSQLEHDDFLSQAPSIVSDIVVVNLDLTTYGVRHDGAPWCLPYP